MYKNLVCLILILGLLCASHTVIFGHTTILNVSYDPCRPMTYSAQGHFETATEDGENEWWYALTLGS